MPHRDPIFGVTLHGYKKGQRYGAKYAYLIRELVDMHGVKVSIVMQHRAGFIFSKIREYLEIKKWCAINHVEWGKINVVWFAEYLQNQQGIFFATARRALMDDPLWGLRSCDGLIKVFHMTHFMIKIGVVAENMRNIGVDHLISEAPLQKTSSLFNKFYENESNKLHILPFVADRKFVVKSPFDSRRPIACVAGSLTLFNKKENYLREFFEEYDSDTYHPMRKKIYECIESGGCEGLIASQIRLIRSGGVVSKVNASKFYQELDIVDFYNCYMMAVSPEEVIGVPSIGFVEAMSCGCAFIGVDSEIYTSIGLIPGVHYLVYDGTLEGLINTIKIALTDTNSLKEIARRGNEFVMQKMNGPLVASELINYVAKNIHS